MSHGLKTEYSVELHVSMNALLMSHNCVPMGDEI